MKLEEINQKVLAKEERQKYISRQDKTIHTKLDIPKQPKIISAVLGEYARRNAKNRMIKKLLYTLSMKINVCPISHKYVGHYCEGRR